MARGKNTKFPQALPCFCEESSMQAVHVDFLVLLLSVSKETGHRAAPRASQLAVQIITQKSRELLL